MRGLASTKMGGPASQRRMYGPRQNTFRFYRIDFTDNERSSVLYDNVLQNVNHLNMQDRLDGENLLYHADVTVSSNFMNQATMDAWLTNIKLGDSAILHRLYLETGHNPYIEVDLKYPRYLQSYSMVIENMFSGWRVLGSHDGELWHYLQDVTPELAMESVAPLDPNLNGIWYQFSIETGLSIVPKEEAEYQRWGLVFTNVGDANAYSDYYTIEFRDGIGGVNLCTGGSVDKWVSTQLTSYPEPYDLNDTTHITIPSQIGTGYLFPNPVKPVTVAIRSGPQNVDTPNGFYLVSSNNGRLWYYHKYYELPDGTWPLGSVTTQEIVL